ncbi:hypothetical protein J3E69DRAFT_328671 [Trichoderma sp. SZMC 28015]
MTWENANPSNIVLSGNASLIAACHGVYLLFFAHVPTNIERSNHVVNPRRDETFPGHWTFPLPNIYPVTGAGSTLLVIGVR